MSQEMLVENINGHEKVKSVFRLMIKCGWRGMREDRDAEASHPYDCFQSVPMMPYCSPVPKQQLEQSHSLSNRIKPLFESSGFLS